MSGYRWFHHGDCQVGDEFAHDAAVQIGFRTCVHPPKNAYLRAFKKGDINCPPEDYLKRNKTIVTHIKRLLAVPTQYEEIIRDGVWTTVRYARAAKIPIDYVFPGEYDDNLVEKFTERE